MTLAALVMLLKEIERSGRILTLAEPAAVRLALPGPLAPGAPPLLAFRYLEGKQRNRFSGIDLVMDDAGH